MNYFLDIESVSVAAIFACASVLTYALYAADLQPPCLCISRSLHPASCMAVADDFLRLCREKADVSCPRGFSTAFHVALMCEVGMGHAVFLNVSNGA